MMDKLPPIFCLLICSLWGISIYAQNDWQLIHAEQKGALDIQLQLKKQINPTQKEWISLEINTKNPEEFSIKKAAYQVQLRAYEGRSEQVIKEAFFSVVDPIDFMGQDKLPVNYSGQHLLPKHIQNRTSISTKIAALLGYPGDKPWTIKMVFSLQLEIQDDPEIKIHWPEITTIFQWYPPALEDQLAAMEQLNPILYFPPTTPYQEERLTLLLNNPIAKKNLNLSLLLKALQLRNGKNDGRHALIQYLNENHPKEEKLIAFYRKRLFKKDFRALTDLCHAPNIWSDQFLEPIISWFQQGNSGVMIQIMDLMEVHRKDWIKKLGISTILFDLISYRYEDIIHKPHTDLSDRELLVWSSAAQLLAKTEHPEAKAIFTPFLNCKSSIHHKDFRLAPHSMEVPPPLRIADVALEGLLQLKQQQLEELYFSAGYRPPYDEGEAEKVISRIRDGLILLQSN